MWLDPIILLDYTYVISLDGVFTPYGMWIPLTVDGFQPAGPSFTLLQPLFRSHLLSVILLYPYLVEALKYQSVFGGIPWQRCQFYLQ